MTQSKPITDVSYTIGSGPKIIKTNIDNLFSECPVTFELTQNGQAIDEDVFTLDTKNRVIVIETDDLDFAGQQYSFELTVTDASGNVIQNQFDIALEDRCEKAEIKSPKFF